MKFLHPNSKLFALGDHLDNWSKKQEILLVVRTHVEDDDESFNMSPIDALSKVPVNSSFIKANVNKEQFFGLAQKTEQMQQAASLHPYCQIIYAPNRFFTENEDLDFKISILEDIHFANEFYHKKDSICFIDNFENKKVQDLLISFFKNKESDILQTVIANVF